LNLYEQEIAFGSDLKDQEANALILPQMSVF